MLREMPSTSDTDASAQGLAAGEALAMPRGVPALHARQAGAAISLGLILCQME